MAKRGRPPKPKDQATTLIAARLDNSLVERLKKSARENKHDNLSREITKRLEASFVKKNQDPAVKALCFLISELAKLTSPPLPPGSKHGVWRSNPFFYAAFKIAVGHLLEALTPPGKIIPPNMGPTHALMVKTPATEKMIEKSRHWFASPENLGGEAVAALLTMFSKMSVRDPAYLEETRQRLMEMGKREMPWLEEFYYAMPDAYRDLIPDPKLAGKWVQK